MKEILLNGNMYMLDNGEHSVYMVFNGNQRIILMMNDGFSIQLVGNSLSTENNVIEYFIDSDHLFYSPFLNFLGDDSSMVINDYNKKLLIERLDDSIKLTFDSGKKNPIMNELIMINENNENLDMITRFYRLFSDLYILTELQLATEELENSKIYLKK